MRHFGLVSLLALQTLTGIASAALLVNPDPQAVDVYVVADSATFTPSQLHVSGSDTIQQFPSGDGAVLSTFGAAFPNTLLVGVAGSEYLGLIFDITTFTGSSVGAVGTPLTGLTNAALQELAGVNLVSLNFISISTLSNTQVLLGYEVTGFTPQGIESVPEPATMGLAGVVLLGIAIQGRRRLRA